MNGLLVLLLGLIGSGDAAPGDGAVALRAAKILTCADGVGAVDDGVVVIAAGAITAVGPAGSVAIPEGTEVMDLGDAWLVPGFVDLHCHVGGSMRDINDSINPANPGLRTWDFVDPGNPELERGLAGGVTTVLFIPGSGTNMGGFGTLMKTTGRTVEDMTLRRGADGLPLPGAVKVAQGGNNPRRREGGIGLGPMGMCWLLRETLKDGRDYAAEWDAWGSGDRAERPEMDASLHYMRGLFDKTVPVALHSQRFRTVQMTARMMVDEFDLWTILDHSTFDGWKNAPLYVERDLYVIHGPRTFDPGAIRWEGRMVGTAAGWFDGGVEKLGINTDSPVVPQEDLFLQAAMSERLGLDAQAAVKALTIMPARAIGLGDRLGSIEPGKDADLVVFSGNPLDARSHVRSTWVNGGLAYDAVRDGQRH